MPRYITVGNFTIDNVILPDGQRLSRQCGGACLYAAMGIRLWCSDIGIVSIVSKTYPDAWLDALADARIDINGIRHSAFPDGMTGLMIYHADGSRSAAPARSFPPDVSPEDVLAEEVHVWYEFSPQASDIPESYYSATGAHVAPMPIARQTDCLRALHARVPLITVDLPWWPGAQRPDEFPEMSLASAVLPSEAEIAGYFGRVSPQEGAQRLASAGAALVAVKLGEQGSLVYEAESKRWWQVPVHPARVKDPTGAGDAYCGGFLVGLDETGDPFEAALYGTVSASFIIEGFGALFSLRFTRADAEARLAQMRSALECADC